MYSLLNKFLDASYKEHKSEHDSPAPRFVEGGGLFLDPSLRKIETLKRDYNQNGTHHSGMWDIIKNSSFCGGVGACAASFFEQRL